jgi:ABC-2 type transport system permease protein
MRLLRFATEVYLLTARSLKVTLREPWAVVPNVAISLFFLFVYNAGLSGIGQLGAFGGMPYLAFILPVALVSGSVGGAGAAGQALIRDLESRYFTKLRLTPVSRTALVVAPMLSGMVQLVAQTVLILLVALALGLHLPNGLAAGLGVVLLAAGWGLGFAGYAVAIALRSRSGRTAQAATFVFFPLLFLSDTFVPMALIKAGWLRVAARANPTTYVFDAMRTLLSSNVHEVQVARGIIAILALAAVTLGWAVYTAQRTLRNA